MGIIQDIRQLTISTCNFLIFRFPFWDAVSTALLLGEKEAIERKLPFSREYAYGYIGLLFVLGSCMLFYNSQRANCSIIASIQVLFGAVMQIMFWPKMGMLINARIISRSVGVCFAYLSAASFYRTSRGNRYWKNTFMLLAVTLSIEGYLLLGNQLEASFLRRSFVQNIPFNKFSHYVISGLLALCVACLLSLKNLSYALKCTAAIWVVILAADINIQGWIRYTDLWTQYRIIASDICIVGSCILLYCRIVE